MLEPAAEKREDESRECDADFGGLLGVPLVDEIVKISRKAFVLERNLAVKSCEP